MEIGAGTPAFGFRLVILFAARPKSAGLVLGLNNESLEESNALDFIFYYHTALSTGGSLESR